MNYQTETIYAGFWRRLAAFWIDSFLLLLLLIPLRFLLGFLGVFGLMNRPVFFEFTTAQLWVFILQLLYFAAFTGAFGATPGKMILHMKVVSTRTGTLLWRDAIYRETVGRVMNLLLLIGYIIVPFDHQKRTLADRFCDTRVLAIRKYKPAIGNPPQNISYPQQAADGLAATPVAPQYIAPAAPDTATPFEGPSYAKGRADFTAMSATAPVPPPAPSTPAPAVPQGDDASLFGATPSVGPAPDLGLVPPPADPVKSDEPPVGGPISH